MTRAPGLASDHLVGRVLVSEVAISERVEELGRRITEDYKGRDLVVITVLKGGIVFLADLVRQIDLPMRIDFLSVSSYAPGETQGAVRILKDLEETIEGASVLVVEDIIDTGLTLNYILRVLRQRDPDSIDVCVLLDKKVRRIVDLPIRYRGFEIPDEFVLGYGLDHRGRARELPFVGVLRKEALS